MYTGHQYSHTLIVCPSWQRNVWPQRTCRLCTSAEPRTWRERGNTRRQKGNLSLSFYLISSSPLFFFSSLSLFLSPSSIIHYPPLFSTRIDQNPAAKLIMDFITGKVCWHWATGAWFNSHFIQNIVCCSSGQGSTATNWQTKVFNCCALIANWTLIRCPGCVVSET